MKKTIGVFEIENSLTERIFGVVKLDVAWAQEMMLLAGKARQQGATSINLSSTYISSDKIEAKQFSNFADAVKQAVNYILDKEEFLGVKPDEHTFMEYVDFEVFEDRIHFNSSDYETDGGNFKPECGYAEVFRGSLDVDVSVAEDLDCDVLDEVESIMHLVDGRDKSGGTDEQRLGLFYLLAGLAKLTCKQSGSEEL